MNFSLTTYNDFGIWYHTCHTNWNDNSENVYGDIAVSGDVNRVFYHGGLDKVNIQEYAGNGVWGHSILSSQSSTTEDIGGAISADSTGNNIFYAGQDDKLHHYYQDNYGWHHEFLCANSTEEVGGDIKTSSNGQHVFYRGKDDKLHHYYYDVNGWHHVVHTDWSSNQNVISEITISPDGTNVYYFGPDHYIHHYYYTNSNSPWAHDLVICPDQLEGSYKGSMFITSFNSEKVFYRGFNGLQAYIFNSAECQRNLPEDRSGLKQNQVASEDIAYGSAVSNFGNIKNVEYSKSQHNSAVESKPLNVYPIPFTNNINIPNISSLYSITIVNMYGQIVHNELINASKPIITITTTDYQPGCYTIQLKDKNGRTIKVVKANKL